MAKAKKSPKKPAKKAAPKTAAKSVKSVLSKSALVHHLAGTSGAAAKDVRAVIAALEDTIRASISKKGVDLHRKLTRVLHRKLTRLGEPQYGSGLVGFSGFSVPRGLG